MRMPERFACAGLILVLAAMIGAVHADDSATPPPGKGAAEDSNGEGDWVAARTGTIRSVTSAVGNFHPRRTTRVGSQVSGRILEVLVEEGDRVQPGQELVKLDDAQFQIELGQRRASLTAAEAGLGSLRQHVQTAEADIAVAVVGQREADLNLQRMKGLWEKPDGQAPSIPRKLYDDAVLRRDQAEAAVVAAQSRRQEALARLQEAEAGLQPAREAIRWAERQIAETVVRAPYAAVVAHRLVDPGESVNATPVTHLLEIQETDVLELDFALPQPMFSRVGVGTPVEFEVEGVADFRGQGQVDVVLPNVDDRTRSFRCRVHVANADHRLSPGLLAQVRVVETSSADAVLVPRAAAMRTPDGWQVIVEGASGPEVRAVRVGRASEQDIEILEGLRAGDRVRAPRATTGN